MALSNPYNPPLSDTHEPIGVEGEFVVVRNLTVFPALCVLTGEALDETELEWRYHHPSMWRDFRIPACTLRYGMSKSHRRSYRLRNTLIRTYEVVTFAALVFFVVGRALNLDGSWVPVFVFLSLFVRAIPTQPLWLERREGSNIYIGGVCEGVRQKIAEQSQERNAQTDE